LGYKNWVNYTLEQGLKSQLVELAPGKRLS
jgi:hypothetical protein